MSLTTIILVLLLVQKLLEEAVANSAERVPNRSLNYEKKKNYQQRVDA